MQQQGQTLQSSVQQATQQAAAAQDGVNTLHTTVTDLQSTTQATANALLANKKSVDALENPLAIHYKGLTITPGGWLESTFLVRGRNENADITSNFGAVPFNGVANSNLSEFQASRPRLAADRGRYRHGRQHQADWVLGDGLPRPGTYRQLCRDQQLQPPHASVVDAGGIQEWCDLHGRPVLELDDDGSQRYCDPFGVHPHHDRRQLRRGLHLCAPECGSCYQELEQQECGAPSKLPIHKRLLATSYTPANLMGFNTSANALTPNGSTLNYPGGQRLWFVHRSGSGLHRQGGF